MKTIHTQDVPDQTEVSAVSAKQWIGDKPKVQHKRQDFVMPSQFEGSDNLPADPDQADWFDHDE